MKIQSPKEPLDVSVGNIPGCKFEDLNMSDSLFHNINLSNTKFDDINMQNVTFHNINMQWATFGALNLGGAKFIHIGPHPDENGKQARQLAITFEEMMLCDSKFNKVDMSGVELTNCNIEGMKIEGILVTDMIEAHNNQK